MPVVMGGNYIFVQPGEKCFEVSTNYTNYIELGVREVTPYYLEARVEENEFKISGTLLDKSGHLLCIIRDNFIEASGGCGKEMTTSGYRIKDVSANTVFEIQAEDDLVCHLKGTIFGELGEVVAKDEGGAFLIFKGPAIIGKSGMSIGIRIG